MTETVAPEVELEVGYASGQEHPAQGGRPARPGPGRLRRRRQAARDGLRALRPLAVRARAIVSVDVSAAEALDGVYGTLTPDEVAS